MGVDDFHKKCGEILRLGLSIESTLEFFIMEYFIQPQQRKSFFFRDEVLNKMNFSFKIGLFKAICTEEELNDSEFKKVLSDIGFVKEKRDIIAHREAFKESYNESIKLYTKRAGRVRYKEDQIALTDELIKETQERAADANHGILVFRAKLFEKDKVLINEMAEIMDKHVKIGDVGYEE